MNKDLAGYTYGAVLNPYRVNYKVGQGSAQVQREAIILGTVDDTMNYGSTQTATDLVLQMPMIGNNGAFIDGGYGSLSLQIPDGTYKGGDARGAGAVDFQVDRSSVQGSSRVASGKRSFIAGGSNNRASGTDSFCTGYLNTSSGTYSVALGTSNIASAASSVALGEVCTASGPRALSIGQNNIASGADSIALSSRSSTNGITSKLVLGTNYRDQVGYYQSGIQNLAMWTTNATPTVLISGLYTVAVGSNNQCVLQNNNAIAFNVEIVARDTATGSCARWEAKGLIKRGANASTTALVGAPTITLTHNDAVAWAVVGAIALTADTTNGALAITVTGAVATTIHWMAKIETTEVI